MNQLPVELGHRYLSPVNLDRVEEVAFKNGEFQILPAEFWNQHSQNFISNFCYKHGMYCIPTTELIDWLQNRIRDRRAIEIGAGNGAVGRAVGIKTTDSYQQTKKKYKRLYAVVKQPTVNYGKDVIRCDALEAVKRFKPEVVLGCWVTHKYKPNMHKAGGNEVGIDEHKLLMKVQEYIVVGNETVHAKKLIMEVPHETFNPSWLVSRGQDSTGNRIYIWRK